jgi:hypothetical protein
LSARVLCLRCSARTRWVVSFLALLSCSNVLNVLVLLQWNVIASFWNFLTGSVLVRYAVCSMPSLIVIEQLFPLKATVGASRTGRKSWTLLFNLMSCAWKQRLHWPVKMKRCRQIYVTMILFRHNLDFGSSATGNWRPDVLSSLALGT